MVKQNAIKIFEERKVRTLWDSETEEWYFSVVDVVAVLTDSDYQTARNYWKVLKNRLKKEGNETVTNCNRLKLLAEDGKMRLTDVATTEQLFRLIQSIPSPKAEPFKLWMAQVAKERLDQMPNKELVLSMLAELSTKEISEATNPETFNEHKDVAKRGGNIAREARIRLEEETGKPVVSSLNAKDYLLSNDKSKDNEN